VTCRHAICVTVGPLLTAANRCHARQAPTLRRATPRHTSSSTGGNGDVEPEPGDPVGDNVGEPGLSFSSSACPERRTRSEPAHDGDRRSARPRSRRSPTPRRCAGASGSGETPTRTGDTTIFRQAAASRTNATNCLQSPALVITGSSMANVAVCRQIDPCWATAGASWPKSRGRARGVAYAPSRHAKTAATQCVGRSVVIGVRG
jgi:hypothetical protein